MCVYIFGKVTKGEFKASRAMTDIIVRPLRDVKSSECMGTDLCTRMA